MINNVGGIWNKSSDDQETDYNTDNSNLNYNWISSINNDTSTNIWTGTEASIYLDYSTLNGVVQSLSDNDFIEHNPSDSDETTNHVNAMEFDCHNDF